MHILFPQCIFMTFFEDPWGYIDFKMCLHWSKLKYPYKCRISQQHLALSSPMKSFWKRVKLEGQKELLTESIGVWGET